MSESDDYRRRRDEIAEGLKAFRPIIVEADEWRPLADHVMALIGMAIREHNREGDMPGPCGHPLRFSYATLSNPPVGCAMCDHLTKIGAP